MSSSRLRRLIKQSLDDPNSYEALLNATAEAASSMRMLAMSEDERKYRRCPVCQEWHREDEFHCPYTHETLPEGTTKEQFDEHLKKTLKLKEEGKLADLPALDEVPPLLKVTKALLFDIEAALPLEAVTGGKATWRPNWLKVLRNATHLDEIKSNALSLQARIKDDWCLSTFNPKMWKTKLGAAASTEDAYNLILSLDQAINFSDGYDNPGEGDTKARPLRKMARPELALKWGYKPGEFYTDKKLGITGRALHVQDGRLVIEILHPSKTKGKMKRYTMSQAKQALHEAKMDVAQMLAKQVAAGSNKRSRGLSLASLRKQLKATDVLKSLKDGTNDTEHHKASPQDEQLAPPLTVVKRLFNDIVDAIAAHVPGMKEESEDTLAYKINNIRHSISASASHEGLQRCLLEAEKIVGARVSSGWGTSVRSAASATELVPLIVELDEGIDYRGLETQLASAQVGRKRMTKPAASTIAVKAGKRAVKRSFTGSELATRWGFPPDQVYVHKRTGRKVTVKYVQDRCLVVDIAGTTSRLTLAEAKKQIAHKDEENDDAKNNDINADSEYMDIDNIKGSPMNNEDNPRDSRSGSPERVPPRGDLSRLLAHYKGQCSASRIVREGKMDIPEIPLMATFPMTQNVKFTVCAQSILLDMCQALPDDAIRTRASLDRHAIMTHVLDATTPRALASAALSLEKAIRDDALQPWHESDTWQRECRSIRGMNRLLEILLRLDSDIRYNATAEREAPSPSPSPPPPQRYGRARKGVKRRTRPDLAIKWGYIPGAIYYDRKLKQKGRCLYVQAGNLVVKFGEAQHKRYNMDSARRQLRRYTRAEGEEEEDGGDDYEDFDPSASPTNSGMKRLTRRGEGRPTPRPQDGTHYRYSDEAVYIGSIRAWSMSWIEYIPAGVVVRLFSTVELLRGPPGEYGVWMLLRTGEGRGARSVAYLVEFKTHKVGWVDLGQIRICSEESSAQQLSEMQELQAKLRRTPFAPAKIRPLASGRRSAANKRRRNFDLFPPERPLRRSRRQEVLMQSGGGGRVPRKFELVIASLRARVQDLETHNIDLVEHNSLLLAKLNAIKGGDDFKAAEAAAKAVEQQQAKAKDGVADGQPLWTSLPSRGGGELQVVEKPPPSARERVLTWDTEILSVIFSFLNIRQRAMMSSVCVLWNTPLINQEITTLDFPKMRNLVTDEMIQSVATKHTEVDTLCLEHCKRLTDTSICSLAEHYAKELTYVNISYCPRLTDKAIKGLEKCRNLKTLIIIGCNNVTTKAVRNLSAALRHVQLYPPL